MLTNQDKLVILEWYEEYLREELEHLPRTVTSYSLVLKDYFNDFLINRVDKDDYDELFSIERISKITRRANYVRPSLINYLDFLSKNNFIKNEEKLLRYRENIYSSFKQPNDDPKTKRKRKRDYITPNEIRNIFEGNVKYKDTDEELIAPLICSLSYFYMFKQREVIRLKLSDVDLKKRVIKNIRTDDNPDLVEWLEMNETTLKYMKRYLDEYRSLYKDSANDELLLYQGKPIQNSDINSRVMSCYGRKSNAHLFKGSINQENLLKSKMLYTLIATDGKGITDILVEQDMDEYLKQALIDFAEKKRVEISVTSLSKNPNYNDILPQKASTKIESITSSRYSPKNDISEMDLINFDVGEIMKPKESKLTIQRLVRNSSVTEKLKLLYNNKCQLCETALRKSNGEFMSEGHHIRPYNKHHRGDDNEQNIIILCPNCHSQFDDLYYAIHPETLKVHCIFPDDEKHLKSINLKGNHKLGSSYLKYIWEIFSKSEVRTIGD